MKKNTLFLAVILTMFMFTVSCSRTEVYYNAKIYTADASNPEATAFVVKDGRIVYVGDDENALNYSKFNVKKNDMNGLRIIPSMTDSHCHYFFDCTRMSENITACALELEDSQEEVLRKVKEFADAHPKEEVPVINGMGWGWNCQVLASELDKLEIDRPIILFAYDGHTAWVNSIALKIAGVDANFKDINPGVSYFERDKDGNPTGRVIETAQSYWISQKIKTISEANIASGIENASKYMNSFGVTSLYDAGSFIADDETALKAAYSKPNNTMRLYTSICYNGAETDEEYIERAKTLRSKYSTDMIHPNTFKTFKDGTIEVATAYMFEPYKEPLGGGYGNCMIANEDLLRIAKKAADEGFDIHIHAIGDRAVSETLDVMHELGAIQGTKAIAHCQKVSGGALEKFWENKDVFYQTTPVWMFADSLSMVLFGEENYLKYDMPLKSVIDGGVTLTFGSDGPASEMQQGRNPMNNIWAAVCLGIDPSLKNAPEQNLTVAQCIDAYTINAAKQVGDSDEFGSITVGKSADFVVLDRDIFTIPVLDIKNVKVLNTYLKGVCIYSLED